MSDPVFPTCMVCGSDGWCIHREHQTLQLPDRLSKREWFAGMAMQGLLANPTLSVVPAEGQTQPQALAGVAISFADAMIEAGKEKP